MRFDRKPDNVFAVQDEIAQEVARALGVSLDPATSQRLAGHGTRNLDAYLAYVKGQALMSSRKITEGEQAVKSLSAAISIDPQFAAAYAALADAQLQLGMLVRWHCGRYLRAGDQDRQAAGDEGVGVGSQRRTGLSRARQVEGRRS